MRRLHHRIQRASAVVDSRAIENTAAEWIIRRDSQGWSTEDDAALNEWLETSSSHRVAFLRLEAAWEHAARLQALGAGAPAGSPPPPHEWQLSPLFEQSAVEPETESQTAAPAISRTRLSLTRIAFAASVLLMIGLGFFLARDFTMDRYATPVGGMASIPLEDGSNVTLSTASRIRVELMKNERRVDLERGEAFFVVAHDPSRPFIVQAGARRIVAVGTAFSVRRQGDNDIQVIVTEGQVRIESPLTNDAKPVLLTAGSVARSSSTELQLNDLPVPEAENLLSWRTGYLTFDSMPLGDAIAEFNRYNSRRIRIRDPQLAALPISGKFRATNAEAFVRVLRDGFGVEAEASGDAIILHR